MATDARGAPIWKLTATSGFIKFSLSLSLCSTYHGALFLRTVFGSPDATQQGNKQFAVIDVFQSTVQVQYCTVNTYVP